MEVTYQYMKKRCTFGRQPLFCEAGPDMCDSIPTNPAEHKSYILRNPVHELIQHAPNFSECYINTIRAEYHSSGANHSEGGWAKDINIHDPEATQRYRRKIEKEDNYIHCVMSVTPGMEHYVLQNNAIDMYRTYYSEMAPLPPVEKNSCRTVNVYRDPYARPVSSISWQQEHGQRIAVTYVDVDFYREPKKPVEAYIWEVENANSPELALTTTAGVPIFDLQFSTRDPNVLVGGLVTGQVAVWDRRAGSLPVGMCPRHVAHRDLVRKLLFIYTKPGTEFFSGGPDGACKWWDTRRLDEPTDEMIIDMVTSSFDEQTMARAYAISVLEYESTIPTRFMVGTENGLVISGNRKGKTPMEKLPLKFEAHNGPVAALERNPAFPKIFMTVGDYTMRIWSEDCHESAVLWSPGQRHRFTSGSWSPTRYSLLVLTSASGMLEVWDLLRRQHEPVLTMQVCGDPLTAQCFQERLFERESKREHILEARLREIRLKQRQAEEHTPQASMMDIDVTIGDRDLNDAATDYFAQIKKEQALLY